MKTIVRPENPEDIQKIRLINIEAFDTEAESNLVDMLRKIGIPLISLVAEVNSEPVGHILFSPVTLEGDNSNIRIAGLAPMAVKPEYQIKGIGSMLIKEGIRYCKDAGYSAVVVLGYPDYYPRFGFVPSVKYEIKSEYKVPEELFMIKELDDDVLCDCCGTIKYNEIFNQL